MFNSHYILSKRHQEKKTSHFAYDYNISGNTQVVDLIVQSYLDHSGHQSCQHISNHCFTFLPLENLRFSDVFRSRTLVENGLRARPKL